MSSSEINRKEVSINPTLNTYQDPIGLLCLESQDKIIRSGWRSLIFWEFMVDTWSISIKFESRSKFITVIPRERSHRAITFNHSPWLLAHARILACIRIAAIWRGWNNFCIILYSNLVFLVLFIISKLFQKTKNESRVVINVFLMSGFHINNNNISNLKFYMSEESYFLVVKIDINANCILSILFSWFRNSILYNITIFKMQGCSNIVLSFQFPFQKVKKHIFPRPFSSNTWEDSRENRCFQKISDACWHWSTFFNPGKVVLKNIKINLNFICTTFLMESHFKAY